MLKHLKTRTEKKRTTKVVTLGTGAAIERPTEGRESAEVPDF